MLQGPRWIVYPFQFEDQACAKVVVRAWSMNSARLKAFDYLPYENLVARRI